MRNIGEPQRKWAAPAALPADTAEYTAAVITAAELGISFTLNRW